MLTSNSPNRWQGWIEWGPWPIPRDESPRRRIRRGCTVVNLLSETPHHHCCQSQMLLPLQMTPTTGYWKEYCPACCCQFQQQWRQILVIPCPRQSLRHSRTTVSKVTPNAPPCCFDYLRSRHNNTHLLRRESNLKLHWASSRVIPDWVILG